MVVVDGISFDVTWAPTVSPGIGWELSEDGLRVVGVSGGVKAAATVTAAAAAAEMSRYKVGIIQTVYESERSFLYNSPDRTRRYERVSPAPAWDGDENRPWFEDPEIFEDNGDGTFSSTVYFNDAPICPAGEQGQTLGTFVDPQDPSGGPTLVRVEGQDSFEAWVALLNTSTGGITLISGGFSWSVKWAATVAGNVITADAESGTFAAPGPGNTGQPTLTGNSANNSEEIGTGTW